MKEENSFVGLRTWVEIDKGAIKRNYSAFRSLIPQKCLLMAVVKSNAYGHGLTDFSKEVEKLGADWFGVDSITEALALRKSNIKKPILVLGCTLDENIKKASAQNISLTISNIEALKRLAKSQVKIPTKIHLKIDTGMHRQGFLLEELPDVVKLLRKNSDKIKLEGIYTHFSSAKNPSFPKRTRDQLKIFKPWTDAIKNAGFSPIIHSAATSSTILFPESHFDMVRMGIGLYGLWPSKEMRAYAEKNLEISPALSWHTVISEIKTLPKGAGTGYDLSERLTKKSTVAILPIGYWYGYPRALSGIGKVLIKGKEAKVLGRISMGMTVVDISGIPNVKAGDRVVIIGKQKGKNVSADDLADLSETINYEITTRLNPLIKRIYK